MELNNSALGKPSQYNASYTPELLFPLSRQINREVLGINASQLPFWGVDIWNHYEVSWLNLNGKPQVALATIEVPATSPCLIESKSMKLYFNSLNNHRFETQDQLIDCLTQDLSTAAGAAVTVQLHAINSPQFTITSPPGICLDDLEIRLEDYSLNPDLLLVDQTNDKDETIYSNLLKSNCPVTAQPDWATIIIHYRGKLINHYGLLKYLISFRNHNEFHEQCVERIFNDISHKCAPKELMVMARFTRRGGIEINPIRATSRPHHNGLNQRLMRQ
jgi:7-cyano-7-deazaguanine reductase